MSAVAAEPLPVPPTDVFVIGRPVGRVATLLLPLARLPDLLEPDDDDRPSRVRSIAKLAAITAGVGAGLAAAALGLTFSAAGLLR
jgi:hypothetical protein